MQKQMETQMETRVMGIMWGLGTSMRILFFSEGVGVTNSNKGCIHIYLYIYIYTCTSIVKVM